MVHPPFGSISIARSNRVLDRSRLRFSGATQPSQTATSVDSFNPQQRVGSDRTLSLRPGSGSERNVANRATHTVETRSGTYSRSGERFNVTRTQMRMLAAIDWYQRAFQWRPSPCRFTPTCSCYAQESILLFGSRRGMWLTIRRLFRCRPFGPSGFDPVPLSEIREQHHDGALSQT